MKQEMPDSRSGQTEIILAVLIALGILILAGTTGVTPKKPSTEPPLSAVSSKENAAPPPLENEETYIISSNMEGPKPYEATINPVGGARPGVVQNWRVKVRYDEPVQKITVTMIMDNGSYPVSLSLTEGTALDGVWRGSWEVKDTHERKYQAAIVAVGRDGKKSEIVITFQPIEE